MRRSTPTSIAQASLRSAFDLLAFAAAAAHVTFAVAAAAATFGVIHAKASESEASRERSLISRSPLRRRPLT